MDKEKFLSKCRYEGVIPVLVIEKAENAVALAEALIEGGLSVLEVTLRTSAAWEAVDLIRRNCPTAVVGVGSVVDVAQLKKAEQLGLHFAVSPGHTPALLEAAKKSEMAYLPGVSTVSEVLFVREQGFRFMKFFPAELSGGAPFLKAVSGPVDDVSFCPTGGITPQNLASYKSRPNVVCVGGSWLVQKQDLDNNNYKAITQRAAEAVRLWSRKDMDIDQE